MPKKERDYSNLRETEWVLYAAKNPGTQVKDYSLSHIVWVYWNISEWHKAHRLNQIVIGGEVYNQTARGIMEGISHFMENENKDGWYPRARLWIPGVNTKDLIVSTEKVNDECLRDHVAEVTLGDNTVIIDLEELLKATRYA